MSWLRGFRNDERSQYLGFSRGAARRRAPEARTRSEKQALCAPHLADSQWWFVRFLYPGELTHAADTDHMAASRHFTARRDYPGAYLGGAAAECVDGQPCVGGYPAR